MNRRDLLVAGTAMAAGVVTTTTAHAQKKKHVGHEGHSSAGPVPQSKHYDKVVAATKECIAKGQACIRRGLFELENGNTGMAACNRAAMDMVTVAESMMTLAAQNSPLVDAMSPVMQKASQVCIAECEKHAKVHSECAACIESCKATIKAVRLVVAAR